MRLPLLAALLGALGSNVGRSPKEQMREVGSVVAKQNEKIDMLQTAQHAEEQARTLSSASQELGRVGVKAAEQMVQKFRQGCADDLADMKAHFVSTLDEGGAIRHVSLSGQSVRGAHLLCIRPHPQSTHTPHHVVAPLGKPVVQKGRDLRTQISSAGGSVSSIPRQGPCRLAPHLWLEALRAAASCQKRLLGARRLMGYWKLSGRASCFPAFPRFDHLT